jgi:hypothetical protein
MIVRPSAAVGGRVMMMTTRTPSLALVRYARAACERGMSLRTALACYRAAGGRIRTETFCRAWRIARRAAERDDADA